MKIISLIPLLLIVTSNSAKELQWWETTIFYHIYPRSFMDSDGDGIGDLYGIILKLEYLKELGVGATWLSPIYKSPMYDFGYDVSDYYKIHDEYGTMEDFERLIAKANELDIKIILDLVPNHGSNESEWFQKALEGDPKYLNYFIWDDGVVDENGNLQPPNNWISVFRKSAWEYKEEVGKFYLHQIFTSQPDFNYRNPDVVEEMKKVIRFWLEKGIAGFRVGAINHLFEVDKDKYGGRYPDEPVSGKSQDDPLNHAYLSHIYTKNQPESYDMIYQWRDIYDEYEQKDGFSRVMLVEVYSTPQDTMRYFGEGDRNGAHIPFNFALITDVNGESTANEMKYAIDKYLTFKPIDKMANWVTGNHDQSRAASKYSPKLVDAMNILVLLLPGIGVTYMGEEIGMVDGYVSWEDTVDLAGCNSDDFINYWKFSRDPNRTPFQWNSHQNAGFSTANKTWLPVAKGYENLNVEVQRDNARSHFKVYKALAQLRKASGFRYGRFQSVALNNDVFAFKRWYGNEIYVVVINLRDETYTINLSYFEDITGELEVVVTDIRSPKRIGDITEATSLDLAEGESLVLKVKHNSFEDYGFSPFMTLKKIILNLLTYFVIQT